MALKLGDIPRDKIPLGPPTLLARDPSFKCFAKRLKCLIGINTTNTVKGGGIIQVHGTCLPGYEPVRDRFIQNFCDGLECNSQLCVYVNNICVLDLFGTAIGDTNYGPDNIQVK